MQSEAHLRLLAKFNACVCVLLGLSGLGLVALGLVVSDPIEPADLIIAGIRFVVFVPLPLALASVALRAKSWEALHWVIVGVMVCSAALVWMLNV